MTIDDFLNELTTVDSPIDGFPRGRGGAGGGAMASVGHGQGAGGPVSQLVGSGQEAAVPYRVVRYVNPLVAAYDFYDFWFWFGCNKRRGGQPG